MKTEGLGGGWNLYASLTVKDSLRGRGPNWEQHSKMGLTKDVYSRIMVSGELGVFVEMTKDES